MLKARIGRMIVAAGYARNVERGVIAMLSLNLARALKIIQADIYDPKLKPRGPAGCTLYSYPVQERTSNAKPFGFYQDWAQFPA